jgi:hypothetical protein
MTDTVLSGLARASLQVSVKAGEDHGELFAGVATWHIRPLAPSNSCQWKPRPKQSETNC